MSQDTSDAVQLTHLARLEAERIHIMRDVVAKAERPAMPPVDTCSGIALIP